MRGTELGGKMKTAFEGCRAEADTEDEKRKETKSHCASFHHIVEYLNKTECELDNLGWIMKEYNDDGEVEVHWDKDAIHDDIESFEPTHRVAKYFEENMDQLENWMEGCAMMTTIKLEEKLFEQCKDAYTEYEHEELDEIMDHAGPIIAQNMCMRVQFGVACECNDLSGNPTKGKKAKKNGKKHGKHHKGHKGHKHHKGGKKNGRKHKGY